MPSLDYYGKLSSFENNLAIRQTVDEAKKRLLALEENWRRRIPATKNERLEPRCFLYALVELETLKQRRSILQPANSSITSLEDGSVSFCNFRPTVGSPTTGRLLRKTPSRARLSQAGVYLMLDGARWCVGLLAYCLCCGQ